MISGYVTQPSASPVPNSKWKKGQTVPVKITLTNASGARIADTEAMSLASACRVTFSAAGVQTQAPASKKYDPKNHQFIYNRKIDGKTGLETISVSVSSPSTTFTTLRSESVTITK